nr:unnamed protein product [Human betaherpesvirus 5]
MQRRQGQNPQPDPSLSDTLSRTTGVTDRSRAKYRESNATPSPRSQAPRKVLRFFTVVRDVDLPRSENRPSVRTGAQKQPAVRATERFTAPAADSYRRDVRAAGTSALPASPPRARPSLYSPTPRPTRLWRANRTAGALQVDDRHSRVPDREEPSST